MAVHYPGNPESDAEAGPSQLGHPTNKTVEETDQEDIDHEIEIDKSVEEAKEKDLLEDALRTVLDPGSVITKVALDEDGVKGVIKGMIGANQSLEIFIDNMDKLSLDICKKTQQAIWSYVTDSLNEDKKKAMSYAASQEDEVKMFYWSILKTRYMEDVKKNVNETFRRKIRIIKEKGINVLAPKSDEYEMISSMQRTWVNARVCAYNSSCDPPNVRTISDIITTFKASNNSEELLHYWKSFHDATGPKIRPTFTNYVARMNDVSKMSNFTDLGDLWRFSFDDDEFIITVKRLWREVKPVFKLLQTYVRRRLMKHYRKALEKEKDNIPAHLLGNLWAQEWQSIYHLVIPYPEISISPAVKVGSDSVFHAVDDFHQSLGFPTSIDTLMNLYEVKTHTQGCVSSNHDLCGGAFRIKWCGESDAMRALPSAARLLGRVQYARHYQHQPLVFRDGPTSAFPDAISNIGATQLTSPKELIRLGLLTANLTPELFINHQIWLALDKLPLMGFAYVLDTWRWDVFRGSSGDMNRRWWELRVNETGITSPVPRSDSDLDPAAKYHVVSHVQYITYLVSQVLEFQILRALCKASNHTGPLHQCSLHGSHEAGTLLSNAMKIGAEEDWRAVLKIITNETDISTKGFREYFKPLEEFLSIANLQLAEIDDDMGPNIPIIVGIIFVVLTIAIVIVYCVREKGLGTKITGVIGMSQNGSLDIAANEMRGDINFKDVNITHSDKEDKV